MQGLRRSNFAKESIASTALPVVFSLSNGCSTLILTLADINITHNDRDIGANCSAFRFFVDTEPLY